MSLFTEKTGPAKNAPPATKGAPNGAPKPTGTPKPSSARSKRGEPLPPVEPITPNRDNLLLLSQRLTKVMLWMGGGIVLLVLAVVALIMTRPQPRYFAFTPSLRIIHMTALNRPFVPPSAVADWAVSTTMRALNFGFTNYRQVLIGIRDRFTLSAYNQLLSSLAPTIKIIRQHNMEMVLTPTSAPTLVQQGVLNGRAAWLYQFKCIRSYEPAGMVATQYLIAQVTIEQAPATRSARQMVVAQLVLKQDQKAP